ncbi:hypothetical protein [Burkholderia glumae]
MADRFGDAEILVTENETKQRKTLELTPDDFELQDGGIIDRDDQFYQEHGTHTAHLDVFFEEADADYSFKLVWRATAFGNTVTLNELYVESQDPGITVQVVQHNLGYLGEQVRHE